MNNYIQKAEEIVYNLKNKYVNSHGLVSSVYPSDDSNFLDHLDDYTPYLLHFGEDQFVRAQIISSYKFTYHGLLQSRNRVVSYQNNEYLGTIFSYYKKTKDV